MHPAGRSQRSSLRGDAPRARTSPPAAARESERGVAPTGRDQHGHSDAARRRRRVPARRAAARRHDDDDDRRKHVPSADADGPGRAAHGHPRHQPHHPLQLPAQLLHLLRHEPPVPADVLSAVRRPSGRRRRVRSADETEHQPQQVR